jgi:hypothetical protein
MTETSVASSGVASIRLGLGRSWIRRVAILAAIIGTIIGSGVAYAYWTTAGTGSGTAKAATAAPLSTVAAVASTTGLLYPGATGDLQVTFVNPNPFAVTVTSLSSGTGAVTAPGAFSCITTGVSLVQQSNLSILVGANGQATAIITGAVRMDTSSDSGCQGATFAVPISFTAQS